MRASTLVYLISIFLIFGCGDGQNELSDGFPDGVSIKDKESENDCNLPDCSLDRVVRLIAKDVKGEIKNFDGEYAVQYIFGIDSDLRFYFCDLPNEFKQEGLIVKFDGELRDACGIKDSFIGGQEFYLLTLSEIEKD